MSSPIPDTSTSSFQRLALSWAKIGRNHPFIGLSDPDKIMDRLIIPSLAARPFLEENRAIIDAGTGVGIPGLPLGLADDSVILRFVEPRTQCVSLLRWVLAKFSHIDASIHESPLESFQWPGSNDFQLVTRSALDWDTLSHHVPTSCFPVIRWSGPDVSPPPNRSEWTGVSITAQFPELTQPQHFYWWGDTELFHVKQQEWSSMSRVTINPVQ